MAAPGKSTDWTTWTGGYPELVEAARQLLRLTHDPSAAPGDERESYERAHQLNERLVRMYVQEGVLRPGERRGREVEFGFEQLLQLVTARHLIAVEGWKLGQIASFMAGADVPAMQRLLPSRLVAAVFGPAAGEFDVDDLADGDVAMPRGNERIQRFGGTGRDKAGAVPGKGAMRMRVQFADPARAPLEVLVTGAETRAQYRRQVGDLHASSPPPEGERWVRFRLTPWTEVHVQEVALAAWNDELVDSLAEKLKDLLRAELARRRGAKKR